MKNVVDCVGRRAPHMLHRHATYPRARCGLDRRYEPQLNVDRVFFSRWSLDRASLPSLPATHSRGTLSGTRLLHPATSQTRTVARSATSRAYHGPSSEGP